VASLLRDPFVRKSPKPFRAFLHMLIFSCSCENIKMLGICDTADLLESLKSEVNYQFNYKHNYRTLISISGVPIISFWGYEFN